MPPVGNQIKLINFLVRASPFRKRRFAIHFQTTGPLTLTDDVQIHEFILFYMHIPFTSFLFLSRSRCV